MKVRFYSILLVSLLAACNNGANQFATDHQKKVTDDLEKYANERGVILQPVSQLKSKDIKSVNSIEEFKAAIDARSKLMLINQTIHVKTEIKGGEQMPDDVKAAFAKLINENAKKFEQRLIQKQQLRLEKKKSAAGARAGAGVEPLGTGGVTSSSEDCLDPENEECEEDQFDEGDNPSKRYGSDPGASGYSNHSTQSFSVDGGGTVYVIVDWNTGPIGQVTGVQVTVQATGNQSNTIGFYGTANQGTQLPNGGYYVNATLNYTYTTPGVNVGIFGYDTQTVTQSYQLGVGTYQQSTVSAITQN